MTDQDLFSEQGPGTGPDDEALRHAVAAAAHGPVRVSAAETDAAWHALQARLDQPERVVTALPSAPRVTRVDVRPSTMGRSVLRIAAAAVLLVSGAWWWAQRAPRFDEAVAPLGQQVVVQLPDGSRLTLAAGSRARWPRGLRHADRTVELEGEGYFDVVHDTARVFRVRARHAVIEDIGTRFLVRAWRDDASLEVHVTEGAVALSDSASARRTPVGRWPIIQAGQRGTLHANGGVERAALDSGAVGWLTGTLVFTDTPVREAIPVLSRWYAVTITAEDAVLDRRLTGRFMRRSLPELMDALALALGVRAEQTQDGWTLRP